MDRPWMQSVAFCFGDTPITNFAILRTFLILGLTYLCVKVSSAVWKKILSKHPDFNRSHLYSISRITTGLVTVCGVCIALAYLGIDFGNLTLLAGALSVGLGFGMRSLIADISAGTVLLSERSIRVGDWISSGTTEGFVKEINPRSTIIETWDSQSIVVPNSNLVASEVTNWTLENLAGRIRVPVSVAYGTDPEIVKTILLDIAKGHPEVIVDNSALNPFVLFMAFGDSALQFELRCYVKDVQRRLLVISDLNTEIASQFKQNSIHIPFPQRDLHIKSGSAGE